MQNSFSIISLVNLQMIHDPRVLQIRVQYQVTAAGSHWWMRVGIESRICGWDNRRSRDPCWLDLWLSPQPCIFSRRMQMCHVLKETLYQSPSVHGWACVTQMVGILHGRWNIRFTSLCTASNRAQPLWHLWTVWPCRKRRTCFWRSEPRLIPPNSAARLTRSL